MKILVLAVLSLTVSYLYLASPDSAIVLADLGVPIDVGSVLISTTEGC